MSAFLYGRITARREESSPTTSGKAEPPGLKSYLDVLVGLVPAELIAAAGVFVAAFTDSTRNSEGKDTLVTTDHQSLKIAFFGLVVTGPVLYLVGKVKRREDLHRLDRYDALRALIPAAAFVGWSMAQRPSPLFDAAVSISDGNKVLLIVFGALILGVAAQRLGVKADRKPKRPRKPRR